MGCFNSTLRTSGHSAPTSPGAARPAEQGGAEASTSHAAARAPQLPASNLGPRPRLNKGDVIVETAATHPLLMRDSPIAATHALMHTEEPRPITHAAIGQANVVMSQGTESYAKRQGKDTPRDLPVFRLRTENAQARENAAKIAKGFATELGGPRQKAPEAQTRYSEPRLLANLVNETMGSNEWTQASAFRAVRTMLRSEEEEVPFSDKKGTTCAGFVTTTLQAAVVQQARDDGTLQDEANDAIEHIKQQKLHKPGVTQALGADNKQDRFDLFPPVASEQIKGLMPPALQMDGKTTTVEVLHERMQQEDSGFDRVGYAKPHAKGVDLLPEEHAELDLPVRNRDVG